MRAEHDSDQPLGHNRESATESEISGNICWTRRNLYPCFLLSEKNYDVAGHVTRIRLLMIGICGKSVQIRPQISSESVQILYRLAVNLYRSAVNV